MAGPPFYKRSPWVNNVEVILVRTQCAPMRSLGITCCHESFDIETQLFLRAPYDVPSRHRRFWGASRKSAVSHSAVHVRSEGMAILPVFAATILN